MLFLFSTHQLQRKYRSPETEQKARESCIRTLKIRLQRGKTKNRFLCFCCNRFLFVLLSIFAHFPLISCFPSAMLISSQVQIPLLCLLYSWDLKSAFAVDLCICFMCVCVDPFRVFANLLTTLGACGGVGKMRPQKAEAHTNTHKWLSWCV